jgi:hypothetical protein
MTKAFVMMAVLAGLTSGVAHAGPNGTRAGGDVDVSGLVGKNQVVMAIGPLAEAKANVGVIAGEHDFRGKVRVRGEVTGNQVVMAIGPGAKAHAAVGAILERQ